MEGVPLKDFHSHWSFLGDPSGKNCETRAQHHGFFLPLVGQPTFIQWRVGILSCQGVFFEHILARLRASYCARIPFFRGWVRIVSSFSGTSPGSTVCFCSFLAQRRARNDSLDFCALQHIKCSRSAVSEWRHYRSLSLNLSSKFSLDTILTLTLL